jgi:hypothetical protein
VYTIVPRAAPLPNFSSGFLFDLIVMSFPVPKLPDQMGFYDVRNSQPKFSRLGPFKK